MAKGKKGKIKTGTRRRKDGNNLGKEKDKTEEDEVSSCSTEPHETIVSFLKNEEVQELLNALQTKDLVSLPKLTSRRWRRVCKKTDGERPNKKNDLPILIGATILGKVELVKKFLREGYNLECYDQNGMTPFLWAVKCKNLELIELYVMKGAEVTGEDVNGDNSLIHAIKSTSWDEESVIEYQKTYEKHFDINYKNKAGNSAIHFTVRRCWLNLCKLLLDLGADINSSNNKGVTSLMMAASKGHENVVLFLLQHNADAFLEDQRGCTALCYAISRSSQKKTEISNQTVTSLLNTFPSLEREKYLIRRLQILMNPGKRNDSGNIIDTFLSPVFSFFVKNVQGGLGMLLKGKVFDIIFQALKNHIGQLDYTVSILGVLGEILNYCDCCVYKTNPTITENHLFQSFLNSQCPKMCIIILKHSGMWNLKNIAHPTFLPLFLVCPSCESGRKWLQDHHSVLQPFYQKYNELISGKPTALQMEEAHLKNVKKRIKAFKSLMVKLQNGDNIFERAKTVEMTDPNEVEGFGSEKEILADNDEVLALQGVKQAKKKSKIKIAKKGTLDEFNSRSSPSESHSGSSFPKTEIDYVEHESTSVTKVSKTGNESDQPPISNESTKADKVRDHSKVANYDPSDLFGLLATSRSSGSSEDSEMGNYKTNNRNLTDSEKEESRLKQVATAMSKIFCVTDTPAVHHGKNEFDKSVTGFKQYLTPKPSEENLEPSKKDLSPALNYLQSLFEDFIAKHRKVWNYERTNNYPDYKTPKNEDEAVQLMKLKIVLSQLEFFYLNSLSEEWDLLINVIRNRVWYSEEASNDVISKLQEMLLKREINIIDKLRRIEEEELKSKYLEKRSLQNDKFNNQRMLGDLHDILDTFTINTMKSDYFKPIDNDFFLSHIPIGSTSLKKTSSQSRLFEIDKRELAMDLSQGSNGAGLELNTIFFNKGYKSDSYSEIVSIGSKTGSSQSIPTPRNEDDRKEHPYTLWNRTSDNPLEKLFKTVREANEPSLRTPGRFCCWVNEINNLKKMIKNSHVQYGEILLPNPLKSGKILLPYGETGYFGSVEMGLDQKGNPMAVKHVKKSFPTSVDILSNIMIRLRKINNKYLLPYYMSDGFEPIIATPLMNFNLGQYILHLKTSCSLEFKAPEIIKEVIAGLHYLHVQKPPIIHGNLKPSNVLIDSNGTVKLAEFGISVALYLKKPAPPCSMIWWPGEVITSYIKVNKLRSTLAADVATAGMLIHFILSGGQHPFGQQVKEIVDNLIVGKWNLVTSDNDAEDLISWMLVFLPENRPTISAIVRHIYFWSLEKRWKFLLTCAGACPESGATPHDISQLHIFLDIKAKENNIQGDWKTLILSYFPNCKESVKNLSPKLTGLLTFLRQCLEERKRVQALGRNIYESEKSTPRDLFLKTLNCVSLPGQQRQQLDTWNYMPYYCDLRSFFFNAFPVISLSIYRMLEGTPWMEVGFFGPFNEPYNAP
ncbi:hypothetical protein RUM44_008387 [Polyplax serrata]|uniref:Protein kinase domain-containing protein n=1 Tax=Polyplax serrata TaxID=468196 RepID=A0ABR1BC78_POLSC